MVLLHLHKASSSLVRRLPQSTLLHTRSLATLGIRREDPRRVWERRAPLTPNAVKTLTADKDNAVEVESCARRCFPDAEYEAAGATIVPKLSGKVDVVLGIKEPRLQDVRAILDTENKNRTWMMFSHTHKGQPYNTALLSSFLTPTRGQTLIDHELLTAPTENGSLKRVAAFGWYAGAVGAGEALSLTGLALLKRGVAHPLLHLPRPYSFLNLDEFKTALKATGDACAAAPTSAAGPVVIGLTGAGNVSTGSKDMLDALGAEWVDVKDLASLPNSSKIYACQIPPSAYFERIAGGGYDRSEYYAQPELYHSTFATTVGPYLTTVIHGAGWNPGYPRIMTNDDTAALIKDAGGANHQKLITHQDITCDLEGAFEFMNKPTSIDQPSFEGPGGILVGSTDILPTELPKDASTHFSTALLPYVTRALGFSNGKPPTSAAVDETIQRARIVVDGAISQDHEWLQRKVDAFRALDATKGQQKRILLLGSGLVAGPAVDVFLKRPDVSLVIASNNAPEAEALAAGRNNVTTTALDVSDDAALGAAVAGADVVVSLLPAPMHPAVAKHCIASGKHLVTASYVSPEMKALDAAANNANVLLLGECGLDPGIDSMAAMRILERVKAESKKVTSFVSWCGGLPEPGASNVPLAYKFSWSPKAVLTAALNDAHYKLDGKMQSVAGHDLLKEHFKNTPLWRGLALEGLANRDAIPYAEKYGLGPVEGLTNLFRGTLRYQGFSKLLDAFRALGLLSSDKLPVTVTTWPGVLAAAMTQAGVSVQGEDFGEDGHDLHGLVTGWLGYSLQTTQALEALEWLSLLPATAPNSSPPPPAVPKGDVAPIDALAALLSKKLAYGPGERDSVLLHHEFALVPEGSPKDAPPQIVTASLLHTGDEKASAMSTTVGCTLAFAALRVADGQVAGRGVRGPYDRDVWEGVLDELEKIGVVVKETWA